MEQQEFSAGIVCLMEDDPAIREIYQTELDKNDYTVVTAGDGEQGLEILRTRKIDIALIDIQMPKKNGFEVMEEMENDPGLKGIPVIILTNYGDDETLAKASDHQSRFYLIKALYTPKKVVNIVREVLHNSR